MGFLVSQHGQLGAIPPSPFLSVSPLESMRSGGAIHPPQKGYLSDTCAIPYENKANGCDSPLCDTISKRYCAIWGGISHWAAKGASEKKRRPKPYWGGENSGNALEASNALNYRAWGIPAVLPRGLPGNALRAFLGVFPEFSGISSRKSHPKDPAVLKRLRRRNLKFALRRKFTSA